MIDYRLVVGLAYSGQKVICECVDSDMISKAPKDKKFFESLKVSKYHHTNSNDNSFEDKKGKTGGLRRLKTLHH